MENQTENKEPNYPTQPASQDALPPSDPIEVGPKTAYPPPRFLPKSLAIIGLIIIGIIFAVGIYKLGQNSQKTEDLVVATPTPTITQSPTLTPSDETADWKTYTNTGSKYSVKYPSEKFVRLICPGEELVIRTRGLSDTKDEETFETCGRGGRFTIEVVTAGSFTEPVEDEYINVTKEEITIAGVTARKYISIKKPSAEGPIPDWSEDIYFEKSGKKHLIHFDRGVTDDIKTNFLSSFKLTQ